MAKSWAGFLVRMSWAGFFVATSCTGSLMISFPLTGTVGYNAWTPARSPGDRNVAPSSKAVPAIGPDRHSPEPLPWLLLLRPPPVAAVLRPAVDFRGAAFFVRRGDSGGLAFMVNLV